MEVFVVEFAIYRRAGEYVTFQNSHKKMGNAEPFPIFPLSNFKLFVRIHVTLQGKFQSIAASEASASIIITATDM